ncbi:MAG: site-specific integrase, partial [Clostridia bacterium]|nr:site-specific integrase [Clostridia bacterium]
MALIQASKGTKLEVAVLMGGFYGLRRIECVGLRWEAFDFDNNIFYINHTVTTPKMEDGEKIVAKDRGKSKSSLRALPLDVT